jgi:hypothetical protein
MLNVHPQIASGPETFLFTDSTGLGPVIRGFHGEFGFRGLSKYVDESAFYDCLRTFCEDIFARFLAGEGKTILIEKSVEHALFMPRVLRLFPEARFIHLVRDGRDVACSIVDAAKHWQPAWPTGIPDALRMWVRYNETILRELEVVAPERRMLITYEQMLVSPRPLLCRAIAFAGGRELTDIEIQCTIDENTFVALRKKFGRTHEGHFFRHGQAGEWRERFSKAESRASAAIAGTLLSYFGYAA